MTKAPNTFQRTLTLHVGLTKTGSSALQVVFARNVDALARLGICYPSSASDALVVGGRVMSGNGTELVPFLAPREADPERARRALEGLFSEIERNELPHVLYSSESLFRFSPHPLEQLMSAMRMREVKVRCVLFVRDIAGHAWSAYCQAIKRKLYAGSFSEFLAGSGEVSYRVRLRWRLETLVKALGRENVLVLHYDSHRDALVEGFMREVFDVSDLSSLDLSSGIVNRSPTQAELRFMRYLNENIDNKGDARLFDEVFSTLEPLGPGGAEISREDLELLNKQYVSDVMWINDEFFGGAERLRVIPPSTDIGATQSDKQLSDAERFLLQCLVSVVNRRR